MDMRHEDGAAVYDVALSVLACLRSGTDVHVSWVVSSDPMDGTEVIALTPGGGHVGSLLDGALDASIAAAVPRVGGTGGIVTLALGPAESLISGLPAGSELTLAIAPGAAIPEEIWSELAERRPVAFAFTMEGDRFTGAERIADDDAATSTDEGRVVCRCEPVPRMVILGAGPIAEALERGFELVGWKPMIVPGAVGPNGVTATLGPIDGVIVMGHDVEQSGRALQAAIESRAGYIGSLGSPGMQELREEWLAYRGVAWSPRIHGPAGLPIGAATAGEIAVSIVAEAVAWSRLDDLRAG